MTAPGSAAAPRFAVPFSYLPEEFADAESIFARIRAIVASGDYTLGKPVAEFEERFATPSICI